MDNTFRIPVVTLKKILAVWSLDLRPAPFKKG